MELPKRNRTLGSIPITRSFFILDLKNKVILNYRPSKLAKVLFRFFLRNDIGLVNTLRHAGQAKTGLAAGVSFC